MYNPNSKDMKEDLDSTETKRKNIENLIIQHEMQIESLRIQANEIAHNFNNLFGSIFGYIDLAKNESNDTIASNYLTNALSKITGARILTDKLLTFTNKGIMTKELANIDEIIFDIIKSIRTRPTIVYTFSIERALWYCEIDKNQIKEALENIIVNSIQAIPNQGTITIKLGNAIINKKKYVKITISDTGTGMTIETKKCLFNPFYSTKENGQGLGLTNSLVIIKNHNGNIEFESENNNGSIFRVYIPSTTMKAVEKKFHCENHKGKGIIIVLDDDPDIQNILGSYLESYGYKTIKKFTGEEILDELKNKDLMPEIKAFFLNLKISCGLGGNDIIKDLKILFPDIPKFILSGYSNYPVISYPQQFGFTASLKKPYVKKDIAILLNEYMISN